MELITSASEAGALKENHVIGELELANSTITFNGTGNVLVVAPSARPLLLEGTQITFAGDGAVVFLDSNKWHPTRLSLFVHTGCTVSVGRDGFFNTPLAAVVTEHTHLFIGDRCLFARDVWIRTSDAHAIYDAGSHARINAPGSVVIGDHVWLGQSATLLKGTVVGSGAIVGAHSLVAGAEVPSNTAWGGNPARQLRKDVFFTARSVHGDGPAQQEAFGHFPGEDFIYRRDEQTLSVVELVAQLDAAATPADRAQLLVFLADHASANRLFVG